MDQSRLDELIDKYAFGALTAEEWDELMQWYRSADIGAVEWPGSEQHERDHLQTRMLHRLQNEIATARGKIFRLRAWQVAASLIILFSTFWIARRYVHVTREPELITVKNPSGKIQTFLLPDSSRVWLNAASSIRYPTNFTTGERKVQIMGEAYFEVAENTQLPFRVEIGSQAGVEVLGTHFNINAYQDEGHINTVLLEGAIAVKKAAARVVLRPGQQAQIGSGAGINIIKKVDVEKVMAWKNGQFNFNGVRLEEAMRQISRWYDIEVVYENGVPDVEFVGEMSRNVSLPVLLKWFEGFDVHFRVENGRRVVVTPGP